jgi:uncharacterized protein (DUF433 family)
MLGVPSCMREKRREGRKAMAKKQSPSKALEWQQRVRINPQICHGKPCIKGTRNMVSVVLDYLRAGESRAEVLRQLPSLKNEDINADLGYAAWLAHEEVALPLHTKGNSGVQGADNADRFAERV